jgi:hypothetical protein
MVSSPILVYYSIAVVLYQSLLGVDGAMYMNRMSVSDYQASSPSLLNEPVVIESALDWRQCQYWWKHILTRSLYEDVTVDRGGEQASVSLKKATQLVMEESSHQNPIYVSSPGSSCSTDQLPLYDLLASFFDLPDWMPLFSLHAPITDTLVLAGEGASCQLQRHPYTTFSLGVVGNQLWRLLPPKEMEGSKSIDSTAWDGFAFSTGECVPSGELFGLLHNDLEDEETYEGMDDGKFFEYQHLAEKGHMLRPNLAIDEEWISTVVLDGDVLIIPPNWWYQSYGVERSVTLTSQRCHNLSEFLQHVVQSSKVKPAANSELLQMTHYDSVDAAKHTIDELFHLMAEGVQKEDPAT